MIRVRFAVVALLLVPALASAQRRGGGGGGGSMGGSKDPDWNAVGGKGSYAGVSISAKDLENASPFRFLLDKKKELKLTDVQMATFKEADAKLKESNRERFTRVDSLKREAKPRTSGTPSADDQVRMALAHDALTNLVQEVQKSYDEAAKVAWSSFDEGQQPVAQRLFEKYKEDTNTLLREKLGARGEERRPVTVDGRGRGGATER